MSVKIEISLTFLKHLHRDHLDWMAWRYEISLFGLIKNYWILWKKNRQLIWIFVQIQGAQGDLGSKGERGDPGLPGTDGIPGQEGPRGILHFVK